MSNASYSNLIIHNLIMLFKSHLSKRVFIMFFLSLILITFYGEDISAAHSGGTDSFGCHAGSKPYHCHGTPDNSNNGDGYNYNYGGIYNYKNGGGSSVTLYNKENVFGNNYDSFGTYHFFGSCLVGVIGYFKRKYDISRNKNLDKLCASDFGSTCLIVWFLFGPFILIYLGWAAKQWVSWFSFL